MSTYVLVHGGWCGGWIWRRMKATLESHGHTVYSPTLTGLGERSHLVSSDISLQTHVADIVNTVKWEDLSEIVLVGHSYGGAVITGVASRIPESIRQLVFLDAYTLENNQCLRDVQNFDNAIARAEQRGDGLVPPPHLSKGGQYEAVPDSDIDWINGKLTPHPAKTVYGTVDLSTSTYDDIPKTYVLFIPNTIKRTIVTKNSPGWEIYEIATNHFGIVTDAAEVAELLHQIDVRRNLSE